MNRTYTERVFDLAGKLEHAYSEYDAARQDAGELRREFLDLVGRARRVGYSQAAIARIVGISQQRVSQLCKLIGE